MSSDDAQPPARTPGRKSGHPSRTYHHGRSPAAWTAVSIAAVGFVLGAVAFVLGPDWNLAMIAAGVVLLSLVVGTVMKLAGLGQTYS